MQDWKLYFGDFALKRVDGSNRVEGYAVKYSDPQTPDLYGDYFTSDTRFGTQRSFDLYYEHGFHPSTREVPIGTATLKSTDWGEFMEAEIRVAEEYEEMIGGKEEARAAEQAILSLVDTGRMGVSTGAVAHLVRTEQVGDTFHIKNWPIGEVSITPRPAEKDLRGIQTMKSYAGFFVTDAPQAQTKQEKTMENEPVKAAPAGPTPDEVKALVASQVADALKAAEVKRAEAEAKAKADAEARQKEIDAAVDAKLKEYRGSISTSGVAIRAGGIQTDDFAHAFKAFIASEGNDVSGFKGVAGVDTTKRELSISVAEDGSTPMWNPSPSSKASKSWKASNATDMNVGTAADGGASVATPFFSSIITRRDELALHTRLGCTNIPGVGTTVTVVTDGESDSEFVAVTEAAQFDQDAPAISSIDLTLLKYAKRTLISDELVQDTAVAIVDYVHERVAIGWAKTMNNLLVTEVGTNGTQFKRGGSITAIADGEVEDVVYNSTLAPYADGFDLAWVMRSPTYGILRKISGSARIYGGPHEGPTSAGVGGQRMLLEYPVLFSQKVDAIAARAKSMLFGAWSFMLYRESPSLNFLFDPYTRADYAQSRMLWYIRTDFGLAQAGAVGYFEHDLT